MKCITIQGFAVLEHELHFIPLPYLNLLKYILCDYGKNEDNSILAICKNFKDKYESFLKDTKNNMIARLTLPLFYITLIKIDGRPIKELVNIIYLYLYMHIYTCIKYKNIFICSLVFNKKLVSFINDICMKMFFAIVNNNTEKSPKFSENGEYLIRNYQFKIHLFIYNDYLFYFQGSTNSVIDEYLCLNISSKCCFLLTAVRGMHSDPSLPNKHLLKEYDIIRLDNLK